MKRLALFLICCAVAVAQEALSPSAAAWHDVTTASLALNRTPPLYSTDAPAALEISAVALQVLRTGDGTFLRLQWADPTHDATTLAKPEHTWQAEHLVKQSEATDFFADACAVMVPSNPATGDVSPSLQMGDAAHPVRIYFWDSTRGAAVMEASGRETTNRTSQSFPSQSLYASGKWTVTMQLPELPQGMPLAVAIWNGAQQDRDGRKYFTVWHQPR